MCANYLISISFWSEPRFQCYLYIFVWHLRFFFFLSRFLFVWFFCCFCTKFLERPIQSHWIRRIPAAWWIVLVTWKPKKKKLNAITTSSMLSSSAISKSNIYQSISIVYFSFMMWAKLSLNNQCENIAFVCDSIFLCLSKQIRQQ